MMAIRPVRFSFGRLERALTLPKGVESGQVKASYRHGVLELTMPASPELVGRKIPIETAMEEKKQLESSRLAKTVLFDV
jgi:Hsp20/alpha crystallin family